MHLVAVLLPLGTLEGEPNWGAMGDQAQDTTVIDTSDATGEIRVRVSADRPPTVAFGPLVKSHYEPIECAVALHALLNKSLGDLWARRVSARAGARAAGRALDGDSSGSLSVDERLDRLGGFLDQARLRVESIRAGEVVEPSHTAGREDRVWMEERGGFLSQVRIDPKFYATYSGDLLASEATQCLAELIDPSRANGDGSGLRGPIGGIAHA